jgi:hypothetical protein
VNVGNLHTIRPFSLCSLGPLQKRSASFGELVCAHFQRSCLATAESGQGSNSHCELDL